MLSSSEYKKELVSKCLPLFVQGFDAIYQNTKRKCKKQKLILREFQDCLESIPLWNSTIIENEYNRFIKNTRCTWLCNLIKASLREVSTDICTTSTNESIPEIEGPQFVHKCYINIGREIWKTPQLFYEKITPSEKTKNMNEIHNIIEKMIIQTLKNELPFENMILEFLNNEKEDNKNITTDVKMEGEETDTTTTKEEEESVIEEDYLTNTKTISGEPMIINKKDDTVISKTFDEQKNTDKITNILGTKIKYCDFKDLQKRNRLKKYLLIKKT